MNQKKMKSRKAVFIGRGIVMAIMVISVGLIIYSLYGIYTTYQAYEVSAKKYEQIEEYYQSINQQENNDSFQLMKDLNEDYIGWIKIEGTQISYPVVQADNNDYYLNHNFNKEQDFVGSIFMDYRHQDIHNERHLIIYGHQMNDGSMFGTLEKYLEPSFYEEHKIIQLDLLREKQEWEIFSVYVSNNNDVLNDYWDSASHESYIQEIQEKSVGPFHNTVSEDGKVLTLSTCLTSDNTKRIIVHARLLDKGDT